MLMKSKKTWIGLGVASMLVLAGGGFGSMNQASAESVSNLNKENFYIAGASVRVVNDEYGEAVRFHAHMSKTAFEEISTGGAIDQGVKTYVAILPDILLADGETVETTANSQVMLIETTGFWHEYDANTMESIAFVYDIPESYFGLNLSAVSYVEMGGNKVYSQDRAQVSMSWVAQQEINSQDTLLSQDQLDQLRLSYLKEYDVTFVNGTETTMVEDVVSGSYLQTVAPEGDGIFLGWYINNSNVQWKFDKHTVSQNVTLNAKWLDTNVTASFGEEYWVGDTVDLTPTASENVTVKTFVNETEVTEYAYAPTAAGEYTVTYQVYYNEELVNEVTKTFTVQEYTPEEGELYGFENDIDVEVWGSGSVGGIAQTDKWASNGRYSLKSDHYYGGFTETSLAGSKWRSQLYLGTRGEEFGPENAYVGQDGIKLTIKASEPTYIVFETVMVDETCEWTKRYEIKEGVNEITITNADGLSAGTLNIGTKALSQLGIQVLSLETDLSVYETECVTLYIDSICYFKNAYVPAAGEILGFEEGIGAETWGSGSVGGIAQTDKWANSGSYSLKSDHYYGGFTDTSLATAKWRSQLYLGTNGVELGATGEYVGNNAIKLVINASEPTYIVFEIVLIDDSCEWTKCYEIKEGVNEIVITNADGLTASTLGIGTKAMAKLGFQVLSFEDELDTSGCVTLYVDDIRYFEQKAPLTDIILDFENEIGTETWGSGSVGGIAQTSKWASNGNYSLKSDHYYGGFTDTSLANSKWRSQFYLGTLGVVLGTQTNYEGKDAIKLTINASEATYIVFEIVLLDGSCEWTKCYEIKAGVNEIVISNADGLSASTLGIGTQEIAKLGFQVLSFEDDLSVYETDCVTLYVDGICYYTEQ